MNIIFGTDNIDLVDSKYVVLELDTIRLLPSNQQITAYCLVEHIAITDLPKVESMRQLHHNLLQNYRKKDWNFCNQALEHLMGFWGGEVDTFYAALQQRIASYSETDPGDNWDAVIDKVVA